MAQVFLAYAQEDLDAWPAPSLESVPAASGISVATIRQGLLEAGVTVWDRHHNLPAEANVEVAISRATEGCDNYVILLSPQALRDVYCLQGLLFALSLNKRIVPVQLQTITIQPLPEPLQTLNWLDLNAQSEQGDCPLQATLQRDAAYHHTHTQLLIKALQWERQWRNPDLLMHGADLVESQQWFMAAQQRSKYRPIQLQGLYMAESLTQAAGGATSARAKTRRWWGL
ncbi:MAG: toll/interleukin-1 receptor domain-containing protein [Nodosilinea sp.]